MIARFIKSQYAGKRAAPGSHSSRAHIETRHSDKSESGVKSSALSDTSEAPSLGKPCFTLNQALELEGDEVVGYPRVSLTNKTFFCSGLSRIVFENFNTEEEKKVDGFSTLSIFPTPA